MRLVDVEAVLAVDEVTGGVEARVVDIACPSLMEVCDSVNVRGLPIMVSVVPALSENFRSQQSTSVLFVMQHH